MIFTDITEESLSVLTNADGSNHRIAYINSSEGRAALQQDFPDVPIPAAWGDSPVVGMLTANS